jgi:hypothetical protein
MGHANHFGGTYGHENSEFFYLKSGQATCDFLQLNKVTSFVRTFTFIMS